MRTFKRCAVSHDNPDYLLRNKFVLLHKNGNTYFNAADRAAFPIPKPKPLKVVNVDARFGMSKDSPHLARYSTVNPNTPSLFDLHSTKSSNAPVRLMPMSPHETIRDCLLRSRGNTGSFNRLLRTETRGRPSQPKMFTLLMGRSTSQDNKIRYSMINPFNVNTLMFSTMRNEDSPYARRLGTFAFTIKKSSKRVINTPSGKGRQSNGFAFMLTETVSKNGSPS